MMRSQLIGLFALLFFTVQSSYAQNVAPESTNAFRRFMDVHVTNISVPTVVSIPVSKEFIERLDFAVLDQTTGSLEPYIFLEKKEPIELSLNAEGAIGQVAKMIDGNTSTFTEFPLPEDANGQTRIVMNAEKAMSSSSLTLLLDNFVALPKFIEIRVIDNNKETIVLARSEMKGQTVRFPSTTAKTWVINLSYGQPLRIAELLLAQENREAISTRTVRFLAQPSHEYRIYFDPDRMTSIPTKEAGNLSTAENVRNISASTHEKNDAYVISDIDADTVADMQDNCVDIANADQKDIDGNGRGDACDDFDGDGIINIKDNCPNNPNRNQADTDSDDTGDVCDNEESRITERNPWLPWAGMGFAAAVLILLTTYTLRQKEEKSSI